MGEPIGMITTIIIFLLILCTAFSSGTADAILKNFSDICWIIALVFIVLAIIQGYRATKHKANPIVAVICPFISQLAFSFFVMLMARDIALVASEGVLGLFGCIILVPLYCIGLGVCRCPNILSWGVTEDPGLLAIDAVVTPILIALACWIFGFFDSVPSVLNALFGI